MAGGDDVARRVLELAERERELVHAARTDELDDLHEQRAAAMAQLPDELSEPARAALRHALALQEQITAALRGALAATGAELGRVDHARTAARGYAPAGMDSRRVLDHTA